MGAQRSADFVLIQIFLSRGRTTEAKQALYRSIAQRLANSPGIRPDDVMIVLTEVGLDDWSFARGEAQYVLNPPAWARKEEKLSA
jgi:phenylpyruvate tautomerase PptA (4-oxalocrotonate tautomerase family)